MCFGCPHHKIVLFSKVSVKELETWCKVDWALSPMMKDAYEIEKTEAPRKQEPAIAV